MSMLKSQVEAQGRVFEETGGFSERLMSKRLEVRKTQRHDPYAPQCPLCEKPMRKRRSVKGEFWGCTGFPECRGTREI